MKLFNRFLMMGLMLLMGVVSVACSESEEIDESVTKITLTVSPAEIVANGASVATFKVTTDRDTDVTENATIACNDGSTLSGAKFSTATAGTYTFTATYGNLTSNEVTVTANAADAPKENVWVTTEVCTPIKYAEGNYYGTDTSVGIEVKAAEAGRLQFVCTPGKEINSYRVQVYPLSWLYNQLINQMNAEQKSELTIEDAEAMILSVMMTDNQQLESIAGKLYSSSDESLGSNFGSYEFDWFNMDQAWGWQFQSDADYLIVTLASFDEFCISPETYADMAICHVKTPEVALVGDPQITMEVNASFSSYSVTYTGNEDCAYMFFLSNAASELDQYIETYGDDMYRDFLRHYGSPVDMSVPYFSSTRSSDILDNRAQFAATAIALDVNGNPAKVVSRTDFTLPEKPADRQMGSAEVVNLRAASTFMAFDVEMDLCTVNAYYRVFTKADAAQYIDANEEVIEALQYQLADSGYGVKNENFKFDIEQGPIGSSFTGKDEWYPDLVGDTEYTIIMITQNGYGDLSPLKMVDFTTKKRIDDQPEAVKDVKFEFRLTSPTPTTLFYEFEYDPEKVAFFRFACYDPVKEGYTGAYEYPSESASREAWIYWMFEWRDGFDSPWSDGWYTLGSTGYETYTLAGVDPGINYKYALMLETWDGYVSDVIYANQKTNEVTKGENPEITDVKVEMDENGQYVFTITGNEDVGQIWHIGADVSDSGLNVDSLYEKDSYYTKDKYIRAATNFMIENGLPSVGNQAHHWVEPERLAGQNIYIVCALGEGQDKDGNPVYTDTVYYVWTKELQKFVTIDEYLGE